jgi:hypothetical protein
MTHTTLSRTNSPQPTYFLDGKRIDNHTFINLLKLAVRAGIEPKDTDSGCEWNIANVNPEKVVEAKRKASTRFNAN